MVQGVQVKRPIPSTFINGLAFRALFHEELGNRRLEYLLGDDRQLDSGVFHGVAPAV